MKYLVNIDLSQNELQNARIQNLSTAPQRPVTGQIYFNTLEKKYYGYNGDKWVDLGVEIPNLTVDQIQGLPEALEGKADKVHEHKQYENQNAFSNVKVGGEIVEADTVTDTLELAGGKNVILTADKANDKITISLDGETVTTAEKNDWSSRETVAGSQEKADKALADSKKYTDQKVSDLVGSAPEALDTLQELAAAIQGNQAGVTDLLQQIGTKADKTYVDTELGKKADSATVNAELEKKANKDEVTASLATKADKAQVTADLALKADKTYVDGELAKKANKDYVDTELAKKAEKVHTHVSSDVTAMTGYQKAQTVTPIAVNDSLNVAIGKLEKALDGKQAVGNYADANHNHDGVYLKVGEAAVSANKLTTPVTINGVQFDGSQSITIKDDTKVSKYVTNIGNGTLTTIRVGHNLNTEDITVSVKEVATKQMVYVDAQIIDANNVDILFNAAPKANEFRVVVTG